MKISKIKNGRIPEESPVIEDKENRKSDRVNESKDYQIGDGLLAGMRSIVSWAVQGYQAWGWYMSSTTLSLSRY